MTQTDPIEIGVNRSREMAKEALELADNYSLVGIFLGLPHEETETFDIIFLIGRTETELSAALRDHPGKPIALIGWRALGEENVQFQVWTFDEFLTDPWAKRLLENFQTNYRKILAHMGVRTELVH